MKLLVTVTNKADAPTVSSAMSLAGYHSTIMDSCGGFLKQDNAIIVSAVDDKKVSAATEIIRNNTSERIVDVPHDFLMGNFKLPPQVKIGRAVVITLNVDQFTRL